MSTEREGGWPFNLSRGKVIARRWRIEKLIREGIFTSYYFEVTDLKRPIRTYMMKVESNSHPKPDEPPRFLVHEKQMLHALRDIDGEHYQGLKAASDTDTFNYLIMNLLGPNLDELKTKVTNNRFTLRTCVHIARRTLMCIEELHYAGFIHRDVKPSNMFIGREPDDLRCMYLGNTEMCRQFVDEHGNKLRPRAKAAFRGSPRYASINALDEHEQGPIDDMWSWFFSIIELTVGRLPWDDVQQPNEIHFFQWLSQQKKKCLNDIDAMLYGCPREYGTLLKHLTNVGFDDKPEYDAFMHTINDLIHRKEYTTSIPLDWEPKPTTVHRRPNSQRTSTGSTKRSTARQYGR